jgi:hypothetical protein
MDEFHPPPPDEGYSEDPLGRARGTDDAFAIPADLDDMPSWLSKRMSHLSMGVKARTFSPTRLALWLRPLSDKIPDRTHPCAPKRPAHIQSLRDRVPPEAAVIH